MTFEELEARSASLAAKGFEDPDRVRRDVLEFVAAIPEPPVYRRRDDPARAHAAALLERAGELLAQVRRMGDRGGPLRAVLSAHVEALCLLSENQVELADETWRKARRLEQGVFASTRLWSRSDEQVPPVFDGGTRRSRFDPRPEPTLELVLACPHCQAQKPYTARVAQALVPVSCPACHRPFQVYVAAVRAQEVRPVGTGRLHYTFRLAEASGRLARVEFDAPAEGQLAAAPRELMAFIYGPGNRLKGALNLDAGKVLWLPGGCFLATAVYGEGAPQLAVLRRFRDGVLERRAAGRLVVTLYYRWGPAAAAHLAGAPRTRRVLRGVLDLLTRLL